MSRTIPKGATDQSVYFDVMDSTSTTGGRKTALVFNSAGLTAYYARNQGSATAITLATLAAANSAHADGGFKEVDATNMSGVYRLDVPDAAFATGAESVVVTIKGATGMVQASTEIQLSEPFAAAVRAAVGLASANLDTQLDALPTNAELATALAAADDAVLAAVAGVQADTDNIQTRLPAALVGGRMDASVGAMAADVMTAAALAADAVAEIQSGLATAAALAVVDDFLDTEIAAIKAKTDSLTFTVAGKIDANITHVKDRALALAGSDAPQYGVNP